MNTVFLSRCSLFQKYFSKKSPELIVNRVCNRSQYFQWKSHKFVYPVIAITAVICYAEYRKKFRFLPAVSAARPSFEKGNREKFNFIANVVNHVAPAVVYIGQYCFALCCTKIEH